jgi:hypothetical protein
MRLRYGSYQFDVNTTRIGTHLETLWAGGQIYAVKRGLDVEGTLSGDGQAELSAKEHALRAALTKPRFDLVFLQDSGGKSSIALENANSMGGVRVTRLDFPSTEGPEFATERHFTFSAEAEYPAATQSGRAKGYLGYPTPPPPLFPQALKQAPKVERSDPERKAPGVYAGYPVTWSYEYEWDAPLVALPTFWR